MQSEAKSPEEYMNELPEDKKQAMIQLRETILNHLPPGFEEVMSYGMIGYVVPLELFPGGYHCTPNEPLPFISIAAQKNYIALYHMGIYGDDELKNWFVKEYPNYVKTKLDMGKSCIRFKKPDQIPYSLISELVSKVTPEDWIKTYEASRSV
jgi:Domain of unknown function (DU1801)